MNINHPIITKDTIIVFTKGTPTSILDDTIAAIKELSNAIPATPLEVRLLKNADEDAEAFYLAKILLPKRAVQKGPDVEYTMTKHAVDMVSYILEKEPQVVDFHFRQGFGSFYTNNREWLEVEFKAFTAFEAVKAVLFNILKVHEFPEYIFRKEFYTIEEREDETI